VVALSLGLASAPARATVVEKLTIEDMARRAQRVVRGVVRTQNVVWTEGRARIVTVTEIEVAENLKGEPGPVVLFTPGGTIDGLTDWPAGTPRLESGDEVVLFLERSPLGDGYVHLAMSSTVFHVKGPEGRRRVFRTVAGLGFAMLDPRRAMAIESPAGAVEEVGTLATLTAKIQKAVRR
jgi:hypothetical protein